MMSPNASEACKHWRVVCLRDGVEQWVEVKPSRDAAIDRDGEPPGPTEDGDLFRIDAPTPGAWRPNRRRLPLVGESAYDIGVKDALLAEGFGNFLFGGKDYGAIIAYLSNKVRDPVMGLFWTIDQETDPYSITIQDLLDLRRDHNRRHPECEDEECSGEDCKACEAADDRAWGVDFSDDPPPCFEDCTACDLENYDRLIDGRINAYIGQFLRGRGISARKHSCAVEFRPIDPPETGGIYFVLGAGGCLKIGLAKNIKRRMAELQTSHSVKLSLLAFEPTETLRETEAAYHARFRPLNTWGEWFQFVGDLREFVKSKNVAHHTKKSEAA